ncbi:thioesterase family protein [Aureibaculum sp. 2210JD6-5]|uniref:acyl-CoA thioesterase n=1 Tax=Aureibaculum sp. 2210JD6-5 TaxID=3103957 RepID=UPI002AACEBFC|nr:thioesterase family protein [Aureibaculum sp. 2210JD6-5]MDY7395030.1 thioesterase family protein [Aureibaculum sp. 2210JD6-5]
MDDKFPTSKVSFKHSFKVTLEDIDRRGHVNNVAYLGWTQMVANMHWEKLAPDNIREKVMWFVLRHEIDYLQQAFANDTITIYTWIKDVKGARSNRMFHIYREDQLLAKCKTTWCLIDAETQKPKRIENEIAELFIIGS